MEKGKAAFIYALGPQFNHVFSSYIVSKSYLQGWTEDSAVKFIIALLLF